jgi:colanic acid/amylovoran biosynthesis protein
LRELLGEFDLAISTRLHACILALDAGTPVIPIAYEPKTSEVFERLEAADRVLDIESLTDSIIVAAINTALTSFVDQRDRLRTVVEGEQRDASDVAELIRAALDHHVTATR